MDANLNVLLFDNEEGAANFLSTVEKWSEDGLIDIFDAVTARRGVGSDVTVEQTNHPGRKWAGRGAGIGLLAGILLGGPIGGAVAGAAIEPAHAVLTFARILGREPSRARAR